MATKEEIKSWLEACGAKAKQHVAYSDNGRFYVWWMADLNGADTEHLTYLTPLHLLNPELTGIQGPTFAEWKKQKGREGKVEKVTKMLEEAYGGTMLWPKNIARKILDVIEGEGK